MLRTDGGYGVPGMPGNSGAIAGTPSFNIGPRNPFKGMSKEDLEDLKKFDDRPQDLQNYYEKINTPGPRLPFAMVPGSSNLPNAINNMNGALIAQAYPGGQPVGNAGALGGPMNMGPQYGPKPFNLDINAVDDRVESVGGSVNIPLSKNNLLQLGGGFNPAYEQDGMNVGQGFQIYGSFQTPGIGINANYRRTPQMGNQFGGQVNARF